MTTQQVGVGVSFETEKGSWTKLGNPHRVRTWLVAKLRFESRDGPTLLWNPPWLDTVLRVSRQPCGQWQAASR